MTAIGWSQTLCSRGRLVYAGRAAVPGEVRPLIEGSTVKLYDAGLIVLVAAVAAAIALIVASQVGG